MSLIDLGTGPSKLSLNYRTFGLVNIYLNLLVSISSRECAIESH